MEINLNFGTEIFNETFNTLEEAIEYLKNIQATYEYCKGDVEKTEALIHF